MSMTCKIDVSADTYFPRKFDMTDGEGGNPFPQLLSVGDAMDIADKMVADPSTSADVAQHCRDISTLLLFMTKIGYEYVSIGGQRLFARYATPEWMRSFGIYVELFAITPRRWMNAGCIPRELFDILASPTYRPRTPEAVDLIESLLFSLVANFGWLVLGSPLKDGEMCLSGGRYERIPLLMHRLSVLAAEWASIDRLAAMTTQLGNPFLTLLCMAGNMSSGTVADQFVSMMRTFLARLSPEKRLQAIRDAQVSTSHLEMPSPVLTGAVRMEPIREYRYNACSRRYEERTEYRTVRDVALEFKRPSMLHDATDFGVNLLHKAAEWGNVNMVNAILDLCPRDAQINLVETVSTRNYTPLSIALYWMGKRREVGSRSFRAAIHALLAVYPQDQRAKALLRAIGHYFVPWGRGTSLIGTDDVKTIFEGIARLGDTEVLELLMSREVALPPLADKTSKQYHIKCAIVAAAKAGHVETVRMLLQHLPIADRWSVIHTPQEEGGVSLIEEVRGWSLWSEWCGNKTAILALFNTANA